MFTEDEIKRANDINLIEYLKTKHGTDIAYREKYNKYVYTKDPFISIYEHNSYNNDKNCKKKRREDVIGTLQVLYNLSFKDSVEKLLLFEEEQYYKQQAEDEMHGIF